MLTRVLAAFTVALMAASAWAQPTPSKPAEPPAPVPAPPPTPPANPEATPVPAPTPEPAGPPKKASVPLMVGDAAPALSIESWIKGDATPAFEKDKIYVVEFWATWCAPCKLCIPHLTDIQAQYKDKGVKVISIASQALNDQLDAASAFVNEQGEKMGYPIAWDKQGATVKAYLEAAQLDGIPAAFIVAKDGRIAWIGNPLQPEKQLETVLGTVVDGTFDMDAAAAKARKAYELLTKAQALWADGKQREAMDALEEVITLDPAKFSDLAMQKFWVLLVQLKDYEAAYAYANKLVDGIFKDDARSLDGLAWTILDEKGIEKRDLPLAKRAALRALEVSKGNDAQVMDTAARAYFDTGDTAKAVELQIKAVELAPDSPDDPMKQQLQKRLEQYKKANEKA